ncbi:MAG: hypothetical protein K2H47_10850 [Muribaculaceae bacterium]|nr:hypothetical protein [Muribaculaceae bacterium]
MELEDIKSKWQSVKPLIDPQLNDEIVKRSISKGTDAKSRLLKRSLWSQIFVSGCLMLLATSRIWAPVKYPYWWLILFCIILLFTILCSLRGYNIVKKINLWEDSNTKIMATVVSLQKQYRNMELITCIAALPLLLWIPFMLPSVKTWGIFFCWSFTLLAFIFEYVWYKSNVKQLNNLINWENE